jgi:hypothetical protein
VGGQSSLSGSGLATHCKGEYSDSSEEPPEHTGGDSDSDLIESDDNGQISSDSGDNDDLVDSDD